MVPRRRPEAAPAGPCRHSPPAVSRRDMVCCPGSPDRPLSPAVAGGTPRAVPDGRPPDGQRNLEARQRPLGEDQPTQEEMDPPAGAAAQGRSAARRGPARHGRTRSIAQTPMTRRALMTKLRNPMALRLPLFDPDRFLTATMPFVRPLFTAAGFVAWLALVLVGLVLGACIAASWPAISPIRCSAPKVLLLLLVYPAPENAARTRPCLCHQGRGRRGPRDGRHAPRLCAGALCRRIGIDRVSARNGAGRWSAAPASWWRPRSPPRSRSCCGSMPSPAWCARLPSM